MFPSAADATDFVGAVAARGLEYTGPDNTDDPIDLRAHADRSLPDRLLGKAFTGVYKQFAERIAKLIEMDPSYAHPENRLGINKREQTLFRHHKGMVFKFVKATLSKTEQGKYTFKPLKGVDVLGISMSEAIDILKTAAAIAATTADSESDGL